MKSEDSIQYDDQFLARFAAGELTNDELQTFKQDPDFETYQSILRVSDDLEVDAIDLNKHYEAIQRKKNRARVTHRISRRRVLTWSISTAASLLLLTWIFFRQDTNEVVETGIAETTQVELPDGSTVYLNAESQLTFVKKTFSSERHVTLRGEAFFDVQSGAGFEVETENGFVNVLGTSFNVRAMGRYFEVNCVTGRVEVSKEKNVDPQILMPGESLSSDKRSGWRKFKMDQAGLWRKGRSAYKSVPFAVVIEALESQFDVNIETKDLDLESRFSGRFVHDNLNRALNMTLVPMGYQYQIENNTVIITESAN